MRRRVGLLLKGVRWRAGRRRKQMWRGGCGIQQRLQALAMGADAGRRRRAAKGDKAWRRARPSAASGAPARGSNTRPVSLGGVESEFCREMWKMLNWTVWVCIFANAAFGDVLAMGLYFYGLRSTSAAYSSIFQNLIPVATFIIAMVQRTENLSLRKLPGKMKLLGALLCVGGTMMVSLLRGTKLHLWRTNLLMHAHDQAPASTAGAHHDKVVGTLWLCGSCVSYALYFIVQQEKSSSFRCD